MSQIIEVRFINDRNTEILADEFTKASSHREAIELTLGVWSGGVGVLKEIRREGEGKFVPAGGNSCWQYIYECTLEGPPEDQSDKYMLAVLFAQYKEKEEGE